FVVSAEKRDWSIFTDPTLNLDRPATRGEIVKTFLQVLDIPLQWPKGTVFRDVNRRTAFASAIETAASIGLVSGKTDSNGKATGYFGPSDQIDRASLSKIVTLVIEKFRDQKSSSSASSSSD